ncbi:MAG: GTPase ObgE [Rickettsiaceae bacterium]|nr:MAG: GTPase ObgE [Rickettsiaceae bacterium]
MHFIDEAKIYLKAGDGGNGCVSFRRDKYEDMGGPDGGDGGKGSSVIFQSNSHINTLLNYRYKQHFKGENGEQGKGANRSGKSKASMILEVPVGAQIFTEEGLLLYDFVNDEQQFEVLKGGRGGLGNVHFKSSINQAPKRKTSGETGQELWVWIKLKLLSDVGLIGFPNAGKSTFLAATTLAKPKIADYPFTTLSPGLGVVYVGEEEFVLADIPGLIEGANSGRGLGDRFLKHIERCKVLIHLIDATSDDVLQSYSIIRSELESYSSELKNKIEIVCLNKCDLLSKEEIFNKTTILSNYTNNKVFNISTYTKSNLHDVLKLALERLKNHENT